MANYVSYSDATELMTAIGNKLSGKVDTSDVGSANGVAELDANGRVPSSQLPSYVDDVLEYADLAHFPATGETGKIYIAEDTNKTYRWSGLGYAEISESLALGETSSTAYAGNKGKANADAIAAIKDGANIDSFGDVETALAGKANSSDLGDKSNLTTTDKSSCVAAINEVNGGVINLAAMISANPLSHNGIYTGRNLGTISSASDWATFRAKYGIADKSYKGLYLGDYVKVNDGTYNADWMVAGFNTETNKGNTNIPGECVSMIPRLGDGCGSSYMNSTNVTTGGYKDSYMNTTKLPDVATKLTTIFGSNLVTRDVLVSKTVTNGYASDWEWISCKCSLLTSVQVYGSLSLENTGGTYFAGYNIGEGYEKLPVFNFIHPVQFSRSDFWLRGVNSDTTFCRVSGTGNANYISASTTFGVRPLICLS